MLSEAEAIQGWYLPTDVLDQRTLHFMGGKKAGGYNNEISEEVQRFI